MTDFNSTPEQPTTPPTPPVTPPAPPAYGQYAQPGAQQPPTGPAGFPQAGFPQGGMPQANPYNALPVTPQLKVGDAMRFAWHKFKQNWLAWVLFSVVIMVVSAIFQIPSANQLSEQMQNIGNNNTLVQTGVTIGASFLSMVGAVLAEALQAMAKRSALVEADGGKPSFSQFFSGNRIGVAILTAIIVSIGTSLAAVVTLGIGGLVFALFTVFAVFFVLDQGLTPFQGIAASFRLVAKNAGAVILLMLALVGINILGALALGVGVLVTLPLSTLAMGYAFRRLTGGTII
ncbi:MAG: hypothetical protein LBH13_10870 [Cellulomonadaceae bacterium]|jgi:uncharacterized membrane protein|nr:hypothetical protein [Cellulomonadaceae bacterium]